MSTLDGYIKYISKGITNGYRYYSLYTKKLFYSLAKHKVPLISA